MINDHRQWLYKGEKGRIFELGEEIPNGWYDVPNATCWSYAVAAEPEEDAEDELDSRDLDPDDAEEDEYFCAECGMRYKEKFWYDKHMKEKHGVE